MNDNIHTVPRNGGWANTKEGADRVSKIFGTKAEAVKSGRSSAILNKSEHVIHNKDGKISDRNSYGNDPHPPKG